MTQQTPYRAVGFTEISRHYPAPRCCVAHRNLLRRYFFLRLKIEHAHTFCAGRMYLVQTSHVGDEGSVNFENSENYLRH